MKISNDYTVHKTQQIIDINNGLNQFSASVQIMSENEDDEFDILVVTQNDLDNIDFKSNYKRIQHFIEIKVDSDENNNDNYVLVIKADKPTNVNITMNLEEKNTQKPNKALTNLNKQLQPKPNKPPKKSLAIRVIDFIRKNIIIILLVIFLGCGAYVYYYKPKVSKNNHDTSNIINNELTDNLATKQPPISTEPINVNLTNQSAPPQLLNTSVTTTPLVAPTPVVAPPPVVAHSPVVAQTPAVAPDLGSGQLNTTVSMNDNVNQISSSLQNNSSSSSSSNRESVLQRLRNLRERN